MRITHDMLLKIATDTVNQRTAADAGIIAVYLRGILLKPEHEPTLGNTADIDLVFIHSDDEPRREIVRLTADVHLDIEYHPKARYEPARELRTAPWRGTTLFNARPMYDPQHFLDFVQASVRGMFDQPDNIIGRAEPLLTAARQTWIGFHNTPTEHGPQQVGDFLQALENIANALCCLNGAPLSERRFLLDFPSYAQELGQPSLYPGLLGLLGAVTLPSETIQGWLPSWGQAYDQVSALAQTPAKLHSNRKGYYQRGIEALLAGEQPPAAIWPLLRTWTEIASLLHPGSPHALDWQAAVEQLNLAGAGFEDRLAGLDAYLDTVEELFDDWKAKHGL